MTSFQGCKPDKKKGHQVYKPNIYIHSTENIQLSLKIEFPLGGEIVTSVPDYGSGWNISVDTTGLIDNKYTYLFYESIQPDVWQTAFGWVVKASELESFFRKNMASYGFKGQEIEDFIEYWIPRLKDYEYYSICPQTSDLIGQVIHLNFSKEPDQMLRLFYLIEGHNNFPGKLAEADINNFKREGYFVAEWGVILF